MGRQGQGSYSRAFSGDVLLGKEVNGSQNHLPPTLPH